MKTVTVYQCCVAVSYLLLCIGFVLALEDNDFKTPEKRLFNVLHSNAIHKISRKGFLANLEKSLYRERRNHRYMTDAGYGSRVQAASKIANALIARHDLFGSYGPGRKKRLSPLENSDVSQTLA